jgi:hypothetical protein
VAQHAYPAHRCRTSIRERGSNAARILNYWLLRNDMPPGPPVKVVAGGATIVFWQGQRRRFRQPWVAGPNFYQTESVYR